MRRSVRFASVVVLFSAANAMAQPGMDPGLPCGTGPATPGVECLATGPFPGEAGPFPEAVEGDSVVWEPSDPPPWTPGIFDPVTRTSTLLPIPPGYVDWDPGYEAEDPGALGCIPEACLTPQMFEAVIGADTRDHVTNTVGYPWCAIGLVLCTFDNGLTYQGTGAMIGPKHMLTCGHNLYNRRLPGVTDGWAQSFRFYPGQTSMTRPRMGGGVEANPNARPFGSASWAHVYWWTAWITDHDRDFDMMLVVLDQPLGNTVGWFGRQTGGADVDLWRQLSGYPGDKPAFQQWWAGGTVSAVTRYQMRYDNDTFGGHSGSPVWIYDIMQDQRFIRAVHIGDRTATAANPNRAVLMNRGKFDTISGWKAANPKSGASSPGFRGPGGCEDCGPDCNANGVSDSLDIAGMTSSDTNGDGIPDECQPEIVTPADEIICLGPTPQSVPVNGIATITVRLLRQGMPLAGRFVNFSSPTLNVKFFDGLVGDGGATAVATTDPNGEIAMHFSPTAAGPGTIRTDVAAGSPFSECMFNSTPVPVAVEDLRVEAVDAAVRLAWRLPLAALADLAGVDVERAETEAGPYATRTAASLAPARAMAFEDPAVQPGGVHWYRLVIRGRDGSSQATHAVRIEVPVTGGLRTALDSPADRGGESLEIRYRLGGATVPVRLDLYDMSGRHVRSLARASQGAGAYVVSWDRRDHAGASLARGIYLVRLHAGGEVVTRKLALLRR